MLRCGVHKPWEVPALTVGRWCGREGAAATLGLRARVLWCGGWYCARSWCRRPSTRSMRCNSAATWDVRPARCRDQQAGLADWQNGSYAHPHPWSRGRSGAVQNSYPHSWKTDNWPL